MLKEHDLVGFMCFQALKLVPGFPATNDVNVGPFILFVKFQNRNFNYLSPTLIVTAPTRRNWIQRCLIEAQA